MSLLDELLEDLSMEGFELRQVVSRKCRAEVPPDLKRRIAEALGEPTPPESI